MKLFKHTVLCSLLLSIVACTEEKGKTLSDVNFVLCHLDCDSLSIFNLEHTAGSYEFFRGDRIEKLKWCTSVPCSTQFNNYRIELCISEGIMTNPEEPICRNAGKNHNPDVESRIKSAYLTWDYDFFRSNASIYRGEETLKRYYLSEIVDAINVTCSDKLYGMEPGSPLNQYISIGTCGSWTTYGVVCFADYPSDIIKFTTVSMDHYLTRNPYLNAGLVLSFNSSPQELPLSTSFTVEIILKNGKRLVNTTPVIYLH